MGMIQGTPPPQNLEHSLHYAFQKHRGFIYPHLTENQILIDTLNALIGLGLKTILGVG